MVLLVGESVSPVEQLLSRQPVVGDVAGLPADQVVRHAVRLRLTAQSLLFLNFLCAWPLQRQPRTHHQARDRELSWCPRRVAPSCRRPDVSSTWRYFFKPTVVVVVLPRAPSSDSSRYRGRQTIKPGRKMSACIIKFSLFSLGLFYSPANLPLPARALSVAPSGTCTPVPRLTAVSATVVTSGVTPPPQITIGCLNFDT